MCARAELTSGLELPTFRNVALSSTPLSNCLPSAESSTDSEYT